LDAGELTARANQLVYRHLVRPLVDALAEAPGGAWWGGGAGPGPVLDVMAGAGALSGLLADVVAFDARREPLRTNPARWRVRGDPGRLPFRSDAFGAAACAFGISWHRQPARVLAELARVAPTVAVLAWARPDTPHAPREAVGQVLVRHAGSVGARPGLLVGRLADRVGHPFVLRNLLVGAGLRARARHVSVEVPWPGAEEFVAYRLARVNPGALATDLATVHREAVEAVAALPAEQRTWCPRLVLALGHR